jgi:hypothetical protein
MRVTSGPWDGEKVVSKDQVLKVWHAIADARSTARAKRHGDLRRGKVAGKRNAVTPISDRQGGIFGVDIEGKILERLATSDKTTIARPDVPQCSPPSLLTTAACGGLGSTPDR